MSEAVVVGTGVHVGECRDPERVRRAMSLEDRAELAHRRAGDIVFASLTWFVEFDDESGQRQRWDGTPQGPYALPIGSSATSILLERIDYVAQDHLGNLRGHLGIAGIEVSRSRASRSRPRPGESTSTAISPTALTLD